MYSYYQVSGGEEVWKPVPMQMRAEIESTQSPRYFTVLAVSEMVEDLPREDRDKLRHFGPLYFDWDCNDISTATVQALKLLSGLEERGFNIGMAKLFATGGRGYHCEIPMECFMAKVPKTGILHLPVFYKEMALALAVDHLDLAIYSAGRGRMWRATNVKRENGRYKVPVSWTELKEMTPERYAEITSTPRAAPTILPPKQALDLTLAYDKSVQTVTTKIGKRRKKGTTDNTILRKSTLPSLTALLNNRGVKPGTGFQKLSLQLGILADAMGWDENQLIEKSAGLLASHDGDGNRYNTPEKREAELVRMHRYTHENPCYEFSIGALKSLMSHDAPDLDGIPVTEAEVEANIAGADSKPADSAEQAPSDAPAGDAYNDIAAGLTLTKYGVYVNTEEGGKKRICALSFDDVLILRDTEKSAVSCYQATVLVNGKSAGTQTLELDTFSGLQAFNKFAARYAHIMQGSDAHVRSLHMRIAQQAMANDKVRYVAKREGLDVLSIPGHEEVELQKPFIVWADNRGVMMEPRAAASSVTMSFQGYPDVRGVYRTDLSDAPELADWAETPKREDFRKALHSFIGCQKNDVIGNYLGWYTACFYRMIFNKVYQKFPLLHVNGGAGGGKTEMNRAMLSLFYFNQDPKELTPQSSLFAIQQHMSASASIPLLIDEYKPHEMPPDLHSKLKLLWRDAYNNREITKGGGNRDSEDFRSLNQTQISAPVCFVGEVMEEEPATMERVVLVTVVRPPSSVALQWYAKFMHFVGEKQSMAVIGRFLAGDIVQNYSLEKLKTEFDLMYNEAQAKYMLTAQDLSDGISDEAMRRKQGAKQRTVYNFTVSLFGLRQFKRIIDMIYGEAEFAESFRHLEEAVYSRMTDLLPATQAEYLKVLNTFASMSYEEAESSSQLVRGLDYALIDLGGKEAIEFSMRRCYHKYRIHCRNISYRPLFSGDPAFLHAMRDSTALLEQGGSHKIQAPGGTFVFDMNELRKLGVDNFK